ncbi:hypothetical protein G6F55_013985 [Rhizopus delemar]|nr:hypothetical protein G6F31_021174 [Rhizopus arrhizus]KAG1438186.1 hypothetical protein G6F55_013985 [Rhizopus delemar]
MRGHGLGLFTAGVVVHGHGRAQAGVPHGDGGADAGAGAGDEDAAAFQIINHCCFLACLFVQCDGPG